jgi:hypothetical protein
MSTFKELSMRMNLSLSRRGAAGLAGVALLGALLLAACGGGGSPSATSSYAMGRISGFGSVVVNGVHYDESSATVDDEDGQSGSSSGLGLGMVVEVDAKNVIQSAGVSTASATHVRTISLMKGPVESVGTDRLVVLGQTVMVTPTTVFDDMLAGGLSNLTPGSVVKVYGTLDTTGVSPTYTASRIELKPTASFFALRGVVASYDTMAKTLAIGGTVIDVATPSVPLPTTLAAGDLVRVKLSITKNATGQWVADSVKSGVMRPHDSDHAEVEGMITAFTSAKSFSVDGVPVDASGASFPDGETGIVMGARVEVEGSTVNGTLVATKVELKTEEKDRASGFEVDGSVSAIIDASTFTVHGVNVSYDSSTVITGGTIMVGSRVEVHGVLAADGVTVKASTIRIKS